MYQYKETIEILQKAVRRGKSTLGLDTLLSQHYLAIAYGNMGRPQSIVQVSEETVKRRRDKLRANYSDTLLSQ